MKTKLSIGTSGWYYADWIGHFYPNSMKKENFLRHYAQTFKTVELNSTFYHLPLASTVQRWHDITPPDFLFSVKASRLITHIKKLNDVEEPLKQFLKLAHLLKEKLGPILFQLPPHWSVDVERLRNFLKLLPSYRAFIFEFRDLSWFCDEVYELLRAKGVGLCLYDKEGTQSPKIVTSSNVYMRFHGTKPRYHGDYAVEDLQPWADSIEQWLAEGKTSYVYFNNDYEGHAIKNAQELLHEIEAVHA